MRPQTSSHERVPIIFDARRFIEEVPPGSWVCTALPNGVYYGQTINGRGIYEDPRDSTVHVDKVNGIQNLKGAWSAALVSRIPPPNKP